MAGQEGASTPLVLETRACVGKNLINCVRSPFPCGAFQLIPVLSCRGYLIVAANQVTDKLKSKVKPSMGT